SKCGFGMGSGDGSMYGQLETVLMGFRRVFGSPKARAFIWRRTLPIRVRHGQVQALWLRGSTTERCGDRFGRRARVAPALRKVRDADPASRCVDEFRIHSDAVAPLVLPPCESSVDAFSAI